jgi:cob(I)alamin adenosyltransferase
MFSVDAVAARRGIATSGPMLEKPTLSPACRRAATASAARAVRRRADRQAFVVAGRDDHQHVALRDRGEDVR